MKYIYCILLLASVKCARTDAAATEKCKSSSVGTSFLFGIFGWGSSLPSSYNYVTMHITTAMQVPAHVRITSPFRILDSTYTVSNYITVPLAGSFIQYETGKQFKGIEISSDVNVSVTVFTGNGDLTEGYLALPVSALGTRYIAASYTPSYGHNSEILVAGVQNDTIVTLNTIMNGNVSSNETFQLQKFETYQIKQKFDTSGSIITSNKPVAVFSGAVTAQIPVGIGLYQYLAEQIIPTKYWTTQFIVPPVYPRLHFVLKMFAEYDNTEVKYYNSMNDFAVSMNKGSINELTFDTNPVVILANKPISVMQYGHDGDSMAGDPFMSNVQGISQFSDKYDFVTQKYHSAGSNTLAITVRKNAIAGLVLNGHSMSYWGAKNESVSPPMDQYITLFVNVSHSSYYRLYHRDGMKFGAVIYGRPDHDAAYGYPLQLSFTDIDCENKESSLTTSPAHAQTTSPAHAQTTSPAHALTTSPAHAQTTSPAHAQTTSPAHAPTTSPAHALTTSPAHAQTTSFSTHFNQTVKHDDTWCFQCDGLMHLQYCDRVQRCQTNNEVCYVQRYHSSTGVTLFRSGCIGPEQCYNHNGISGCMECCHGNFCNTAGCGEQGMPAPGQRGPICFECTHIDEGENCNTVQLCHSNQACMIAKFEWGDNNFYYDMQCTDTQVCSTKRSSSGLNKRHVPVCTHCCHSDFCNMNCTSGGAIPSIIGMPAPGQRGPVCFECTHIDEGENCNTVQLCHSNQACMIAKFEWGDNNFYYDMQCTDTQVCSTKRSSSGLNKRHVPVCTHCCHSDFCNMNCTSGGAIPSIIG